MKVEFTVWDELTFAIACELGYDTARAFEFANGRLLSRDEWLKGVSAVWIAPTSMLVLLKMGHVVGIPNDVEQALPAAPRNGSRGYRVSRR